MSLPKCIPPVVSQKRGRNAVEDKMKDEKHKSGMTTFMALFLSREGTIPTKDDGRKQKIRSYKTKVTKNGDL